jgi:hypothetical protein
VMTFVAQRRGRDHGREQDRARDRADDDARDLSAVELWCGRTRPWRPVYLRKTAKPSRRFDSRHPWISVCLVRPRSRSFTLLQRSIYASAYSLSLSSQDYVQYLSCTQKATCQDMITGTSTHLCDLATVVIVGHKIHTLTPAGCCCGCVAAACLGHCSPSWSSSWCCTSCSQQGHLQAG